MVWLWPLHGQLGAATPGAGAGDNVGFIWNVWWTRYALSHGLNPLSCPLLLYPFGADLTLHTHTLLPALAVSFVENPVLAQNLLIFAHLFLNFVCAYALALRETRHRGAAVLAGLIFGWSPYVAAHLNGHFNLIAAWVLPLAALVTLWANEGRGIRRGLLLGAVLGAIAYVDYYYFIYASLLALLLTLGSGVRSVFVVPPGPGLGLLARGDPATGGSQTQTWPQRAVKHRPDPGVGVGTSDPPRDRRARGVCRRGCGGNRRRDMAGRGRVDLDAVRVESAGPRLALHPRVAGASIRDTLARGDHAVRRAGALRHLAAGGLAGAAVVIAPLAARAVRLVANGDYVSQPYTVAKRSRGNRSAHARRGESVQPASTGAGSGDFYEAAGVNLIEHVAWLGPAVIVLIAFGLRARAREPWLLPLIVFSIWALGPFVEVAGRATPFWLPAVIVRWIPVVANARIPARAIVVVYLACAMLAAFGVKRLLADGRRTLAAALVGLLLIDYAAAPPPVVQLGRPAVLDALLARSRRRRRPGSAAGTERRLRGDRHAGSKRDVAADDPRAPDRRRVRGAPAARRGGAVPARAGAGALARAVARRILSVPGSRAECRADGAGIPLRAGEPGARIRGAQDPSGAHVGQPRREDAGYTLYRLTPKADRITHSTGWSVNPLPASRNKQAEELFNAFQPFHCHRRRLPYFLVPGHRGLGADAPAGAQPGPQGHHGGVDRGCRWTPTRCVGPWKRSCSRYPPSLPRILKMDPTLLTNEGYLQPYPQLASFLKEHPQVAHNPAYFFAQYGENGNFYRETPQDRAVNMWRSTIEGFTIASVALAIFGGVTWLLKMLVDHRRWSRLSKIQTEVHNKVLDRMQSNEDLLAYIQTPAGRRFLESAPIPLESPRAIGAPLGRILWSAQAGAVLTVLGIGIESSSPATRSKKWPRPSPRWAPSSSRSASDSSCRRPSPTFSPAGSAC